MQGFFIVGASPRSSTLSARDCLTLEGGAVASVLEQLKTSGFAQAVVLNTCDRVEFHVVDTDPARGVERIVDILSRRGGLAPAEVERHIYVYTGLEAVRHLFTVAASLDSTIVGEPHLIGQIKHCYQIARHAGMVGRELNALFQAAFAASKRVRAETAVGERPVSIAAAAVELARKVHGDLEGVRGLMVGVTEIGELVGEALLSAGLGHLTVAHPKRARAEDAARLMSCHLVPFEAMAEELVQADVIVGCLGSQQCVVTGQMVKVALKARRFRAMFLIDTAVPGDIDPAVEGIDGAFLYDLDDLERVAREGGESRQKAARHARRLLEEEVRAFERRRAERAAVPVLTALRRHFELVRETALADAGGDAQKATRLLINRLLHQPSIVLRSAAREDEEQPLLPDLEQTLSRTFGLDDEAWGNKE